MKQKITPKALLVIAVFCMGTKASAQQYEFGINLGFVVYQGDLTIHKLGSFETQKLAVNLRASRIISPSFSVRGNLLFGKLEGDDAKYSKPEFRRQRNFNFTSPVVELSGQFVWNITRSNYAEKGISPYLFAGAGLSFLNIRRDWSKLNTEYFPPESSVRSGLAIDTTHPLSRVSSVIPVGGGINYFFSPKVGINAEASYRFGFSDYLDGFSYSANPDGNDHYFNYSIGLIFRPGKKNSRGCPSIQY